MYLPLDAPLNTRIALVQALTTCVERIEVTHDFFASQRPGRLITDAELAHVRTLALALMCRFCDDARTGLGARLERLIFPDDVAAARAAPRPDATLVPTLHDQVDAAAAPAPDHADFDDTLQIDTLHLITPCCPPQQPSTTHQETM
jgi:hypothetical protein